MAEALGPGIARPSLASGPYACSTYYLQVTTYYLLPTNYYLLHMRGMRVSRVRIVPAGEYTEAPSVSACLATMRAQGWVFCKRQVQSKKLETVFCWLPCGHRGGRFGIECPVHKVGNGAVLATVRAHGAALEKACDVWHVRPHKLETVLCWPPCGHKGRALKIVCPIQKVGNCALLATMQAQGALWKRYVLCPATYFTIRTRPAAGAVAKGSLLASRCFLNSLRLQLLVTGVVAPPLV